MFSFIQYPSVLGLFLISFALAIVVGLTCIICVVKSPFMGRYETIITQICKENSQIEDEQEVWMQYPEIEEVRQQIATLCEMRVRLDNITGGPAPISTQQNSQYRKAVLEQMSQLIQKIDQTLIHFEHRSYTVKSPELKNESMYQ